MGITIENIYSRIISYEAANGEKPEAIHVHPDTLAELEAQAAHVYGWKYDSRPASHADKRPRAYDIPLEADANTPPGLLLLTPEPSNILDLEAIKARVGAATPGPWESSYGLISTAEWPHAKEICEAGGRHEDTLFITHARMDMPALIAELEVARRVIEQVRQYDRDYRPGHPCPVCRRGDGHWEDCDLIAYTRIEKGAHEGSAITPEYIHARLLTFEEAHYGRKATVIYIHPETLAQLTEQAAAGGGSYFELRRAADEDTQLRIFGIPFEATEGVAPGYLNLL